MLQLGGQSLKVFERARLPAERWLLSSRPLIRNSSTVHVNILVAEEGVLLTRLQAGDCLSASVALHVEIKLPGNCPHVTLSLGGSTYWTLQPFYAGSRRHVLPIETWLNAIVYRARGKR